MRMPGDTLVADLTAAGAYNFGVTAEVGATSDHDLPHAWGAALRAAGFAHLTTSCLLPVVPGGATAPQVCRARPRLRSRPRRSACHGTL